MSRSLHALFAVALGAGAASSAPAHAAQAPLATPLPIVELDTPRAIPDDPKITGRMRVIDRPGEALNQPGTPANGYSGRIGVEVRGGWSSIWPKQSFSFETRDRRGDDREVRLLGLPRESDWILYASHGDRSLMRAELAFAATRLMGRYAPRTRYVELVLNGQYHGVYVLMEPLELGKRRIAAGKNAVLLELTRREKLDRGDEAFGIRSPNARVVFSDPDPDDLSRARKARTRQIVKRFDATLHSSRASDPRRGWRRWLDERSAVDFLLLQELVRNQDGFWASTHLQALPNGRIVLGPPWDFDLSLGNVSLPWAASPQGFIPPSHPWAERLKDPALRRALLARWQELRAAGLQATLHTTIDGLARTLAEPAQRNFARWPVLGQPVFAQQAVRASYAEEVALTKAWLDARIAWLDGALAAVA